jgi:hypothetical protein
LTPADGGANEARINAELANSFPAGLNNFARNQKRFIPFSRGLHQLREVFMGRAALLWLLGVPIPIIILLALFFR